MSELKKKRAEQIQNALDTTLSGIQDDPWLAQHVIHGIQKRKKEAKKISMFAVCALLLALFTATALAVVTFREIGKKVAESEQENGYFGDWPVEKKIAIIRELVDQEYIEETDDIEKLCGNELLDEQASQEADKLIFDFTGIEAKEIGFMTLMQSVWGKFDTWSDEDKAWYSMVMTDVGVDNNGKTVYAMPDSKISKEKAVEIAKKAILNATNIDEDVLDNYNLIVNFQIPEFNEDDNKQAYWYVMYDAKVDSPENPFYTIELFIHPQTGELLESVEDILESYNNLPKQPDNALYQDIYRYNAKAKDMGVYSFFEWPLELRAEYSQDITPKVQEILNSCDLTDLMNCGSPDLAVIAHSTYIYGIPDTNAISQKDAYEVSKKALMDIYGIPSDVFEKYRTVYVYYDVTHAPKWKFFFNPMVLDAELLDGKYDNPLLSKCYKVEIDAYTSRVIQTDEFDFQALGHDLEYDLKWY